MASKLESLKKEPKELVRKGDLLLYSMADEVDQLPEKFKKELAKRKVELPNFDLEYDTWYSEALGVIKQIIPDRLDDFIKQYKNDRRKEVSYLTYGISDYRLGLQTKRSGEVVVDRTAAIAKMQNQVSILKSAQKRFECI